MERVDVHVVGLEGDFERAVDALEDRFGMPRTAAERFLRTLPRIARHQADPEEARAYKRVLGEMGAQVVIRPADDTMPSSSVLSGDLPSLPVPAHGPSGITPSMQTFASSARLADTVPRAPALPMDLAHAFDDPNLDGDLDPDEVDLLMSSPFPGASSGGGANIEFTGLSSLPSDLSPLPAGRSSDADLDRETSPYDGETERPRRRRWSWIAGLVIASASAAAWFLR